MSQAEPVRLFPDCPPGPWDFYHPADIVFGAGCWRRGGDQQAGRHWLLLATPGAASRGTVTKVCAEWGGAAQLTVWADVAPQPDLANLPALIQRGSGQGFDGIIALGGGSVIDTAKVLACGLARTGFDLPALLATNQPLPEGPVLPICALPTTAGSGSEVTPFATVWDVAAARKYSLTGPSLFPGRVFVDPEFTHDLPRAVTIATGLDALAQALESLWNVHATATTQQCARRSLALALAVLPALGAGGVLNVTQRRELMVASLLAGLAISHTRTALAHSISYPLTARHGLAHGLACGFTLPALLDFNAPADDGRLLRAAQAAGCASLGELHTRLVALLDAVEMDAILVAHGLNAARLQELAEEMINPARAGNNLRPAGLAEVRRILAAVGNYLPGCAGHKREHA